MIPIDLAVRGSKRLEALLEARFGATGRGLHEKLSSVEKRVPEEVRKAIRWVATIRNKVVHEEGPPPASAAEFERTVERAAQGLQEPKPPVVRPRKKTSPSPTPTPKRKRKAAAPAPRRRKAAPRPRKAAPRPRASSKALALLIALALAGLAIAALVRAA